MHRIFSFFTVKWYLQSNKQFVPPVTIGAFKTNEENKNLIIDGQQRLTSILLAYLGLYPDERTYKQTVERFANDDEDETDELDSVIDGKTQYGYKCKLLNFSKLHSYIKHSNIKMKYHKKLNCYAYDVPVDFKGLPVKLFFSRIGKHGKWHGLLTSDTNLNFAKAFEIYATRRTIEVFFKECKQYLGSAVKFSHATHPFCPYSRTETDPFPNN